MKWIATDYRIESQSARELIWVEVVRYLTAIFHPPPDFPSHVVQRWHIILWILSNVKYPFAMASIKQALFSDWPFFNPERDSAMNLQPAILIIHYCLVTKPSQRLLAYELLEYLVHYSEQYSPSSPSLYLLIVVSYRYYPDSDYKVSLRHAFEACIQQKYVE